MFSIMLPCFDLFQESKQVTNIGAQLRLIHDLDKEHGKLRHFIVNLKAVYPPHYGRIKLQAQQQKVEIISRKGATSWGPRTPH